jgi:hypothetical protein
MEWYQIALLLLAGLAAGFINTLAGGGSLLTLPALVFLGLPSPVANGTNRVAIMLQNLVSTERFYRQGRLELRDAAIAALPALLGAIAGAFIGAEMPERLFDTVLGIVLLLVVVTLFVQRPDPGDEARKRASPWIRVPTFFVIGIYGGFVQAGVGFLLITAITWLLGHDLVKTNAMKVFIILCFMAVSLLIYALYDLVIWHYGLILAVGTMTGAWLGVRFAVERGAGAVRWVVVGAVALSSLRLFGLI